MTTQIVLPRDSSEDTAVHALRCGSCLRTIGVSNKPAPLRNKVYCSEWCMDEAPVQKDFEERNDMWRTLYASGVKPVRIAHMYNVDHALVYRVVGRK